MTETLTSNSWRDKLYTAGVTLAWIGAAYGFSVFPLRGIHLFGNSDRAYGNLVSLGFLLGAGALICGLLGRGRRRWLVSFVAFVQTLWWWFMAVGA